MSDESELAVACRLSEPELRQRRAAVLEPLRAAAVEIKALPAGYAFRFGGDAAPLAELALLIDLERRCCPFLRFELSVAPAAGPVWLSLSGPPGTREFLAAELGLGGGPPPPDSP
ncbi:MAG TPA: hypothetical protein VHR45_17625 [Thermoanaerobaculia bacterium]|nr:hypothetical protein [Thermoanaerobaculia bacterium]